MKHNLRILLISLCLGFLPAGCTTPTGTTMRDGRTAAQEKAWLAKAYRQDKNGWIFLHIEGAPFERAFQRGYLTADEVAEFRDTLAYMDKHETGRDMDYFVGQAARLFRGKVSPEYVEEMRGIVAGVRRRGKDVTYNEVLFMNGFIDISWYWWPRKRESMGPGCSAFVATGAATADGRIVMAHNSWCDYVTLRFCNIIVDLVPEKGNRILMQSWGPSIYSTTDFFLTSAGLVGTETTIGNFVGFNEKGTPIFERARKAMQYANNVDEWAQILVEHNSGAYANSWLLGDIKTNEIARLELGLKHHSLEKKTTGYFCGSNVTDNIEILRDETAGGSYDDIRTFNVARRERWKQLMKQYDGKIDIRVAKQMLADHYDMYLEKENPCHRTICGHGELDDGRAGGSSRPAYYPSGAIDGKVVDAGMAKDWQFWAKWGSSCDRNFVAQEFLEKHTQFDWMAGYLKDLPPQPWTVFPIRPE
jgi:hypothetical protein